MPDRCRSCGRSLRGVQAYRNREASYRPGMITPSTPRRQRARPAVCGECWRELPPLEKRRYVLTGTGDRFG